MKVTEDVLILSDASSIRWAAVKTLKVLENKLLVVLEDDVAIELTGLDAKTVDAAFVAYSRYLSKHHSA